MRLPFAGLAPLRPWAVLYFEPSRWRALQEAVASQLRCPAVELGRLHEIEASRGTAPRKSRRRTTGRRRDVEALEELVLSYRAFICEVVAPHVAATFDGPCDELVFQANPSLRVVVPGDRPSGRRHCDADYGHQPGQVNFWLPLARARPEHAVGRGAGRRAARDRRGSAAAARRRRCPRQPRPRPPLRPTVRGGRACTCSSRRCRRGASTRGELRRATPP